ncbi:helix-turn-helix domain-containing protein [Streptomyces griseoviridis]|uniref:helix-turn-helix domain-containing protein n=1 Tax=Streptomyces griseoviridis TaxID=45398 RepID=UPI0033D961E0
MDRVHTHEANPAEAKALWEDQFMPEETPVTRLQAAVAAKDAAEEKAREIRDQGAAVFAEAVVLALTQDGMKPKEVADATGVSYETIRRIARAAEVERLREPTVTSRRKAQES